MWQGKRREVYKVPREDEIFMNGSMHSKVLESIVYLKWFIEEEFICFMSPRENFFLPFISPKDGVCEGWTRGMHKQSIIPAALLGWEGAVGGKRGCQESVTAESVRREQEPPQPHRQRIWYWESCCWALTTSSTPLGSYWSMPSFSTASCWEWQKNRRRCKGLFPWTHFAWGWGNSLWSRFGFGALNIRADSVLLLVCVIRKK